MAKKHEPDIQAADVLRMFPTLVWRAELGPEVHQRINGTIVRKLDQIRQIPARACAGSGMAVGSGFAQAG